MKRDDVAVEKLAAAALDHSADSLSPAMQERLRAARRKAVMTAEHEPAHWLRWTLPTGALVAATLLAVLMSGVWLKTAPISGIEDVDILAAKQNPDFYHDDPGFYLWLDGQQRAG